MRNFIDSLKARRDAAKNEGGFSLIDVVVTVAIIVALSVGGFVTYTGIVDNAKKAATASAADQVYTAIAVDGVDGVGGVAANAQTIAEGYNTSANDAIKVYTDGTKVIAVHGAAANSATITDFTTAAAADQPGNDDFIVARG